MDIHDPDAGQCVPLTRFKVIEVMGRRDLDCSGAELAIHEDRITYDGDCACGQRNPDSFTDEIAIALVFRMTATAVSPNMVSGRVVRPRGIADGLSART